MMLELASVESCRHARWTEKGSGGEREWQNRRLGQVAVSERCKVSAKLSKEKCDANRVYGERLGGGKGSKVQ